MAGMTRPRGQMSLTRSQLQVGTHHLGEEEGDSLPRDRTTSILVNSVSKRKREESHRHEELSHTDTLVSIIEPDEDVDIYGETTNVKSEVERTSQIALTTVVNMKEGLDGGKTKRDLLDYVRKVFPVYSRWDDLYRTAKEEKITKWKVAVYVLKGTDLPSKDSNGFSDPYIKFGLIRSANQEDRIVRQRNLSEWEKEGLLIGKVKCTSVKKETLNPVWNEQVELTFNEIDKDVLVIEVWDSDGGSDEHNSKIKSLNFKGISEFLLNAVAHDDFLGRCFYPLANISVNGEQKDFQLFSHSHKHERGRVTLKLSVESVRQNITVEDGLLEHRILLKGLMNVDSKSPKGRYYRDWDGKLSEKANQLLNQHDFTIGMNDLQKAALELNVLIRYHRLFRVNIATFLALVQTIKSQYFLFMEFKTPEDADVDNSDLIEGDEFIAQGVDSKDPAEKEWVRDIFQDLKELLNSVIATLRKHLTKFRLQGDNLAPELQKLSAHVKVADELSTFQPFVQRLEDKKLEIQSLVEEAVSMAVTDWFLTATKTETPTDLEPLQDFDVLVNDALYVCDVALAKIHPMFFKGSLTVDYFTLFYVAMDKLMSDKAITVLTPYSTAAKVKSQDLDGEETLRAFSTYMTLKNIKAHGSGRNIDTRLVDQTELHLSLLHEWYVHLVPYWIKEASKRSKATIVKAIELEKVVVVTDEVKFSSSAVDSRGSLLALFRVRDDLEWPVTSENMTFTLSLVKEVTTCALFYVETVFKRLTDEDIYDEQGKFRATEELSIILNNMYHVSQVFVEWTNLIPPIKKEEANDETVVKAHTKDAKEINDVLKSFDSDAGNKISSIVEQITEKIKPDIESHLQEVLDLPHVTIPESLDLADIGVIGPLLDYLASNLQTLGQYLLSPVFDIILKELWDVAMEAITVQIKMISKAKKPNRVELYERLVYSLQALKKFFNANGKGLSVEVLESQEYHTLVEQLEVIRLQTDKLILRFLSDLSVPQERESLGNLLFTVCYLQERGVVDVNILQARDLPTARSVTQRWSCFHSVNPYVEVVLTPRWLFEDSSRTTYKTSTQKNTPDPVYNEFISLPAVKDNLYVEGASLIFTIFNQSCGRHYSGMGIIPCREIPVLSSTATKSRSTAASLAVESDTESTDEPPQRANYALPLFCFRGGSLALDQISERAKQGEQKAATFIKANATILKSC